MGVTAARHAQQVVANTAKVLGIELLCAAQALDLGDKLRPGKGAHAAYKALRKTVKGLDRDRYLAPDLAAAERLLRDGTVVGAAEKAVGALAV
jgi:histidine ammonia-lyase